MDEQQANDRLKDLRQSFADLEARQAKLRREMQVVPTILSWVYPGKRLPEALYLSYPIDPDSTKPE
jgi:hypothetical protein